MRLQPFTMTTALVLCSVLVGACGAATGRTPTEAADKFLHALASDDPGTACVYMAVEDRPIKKDSPDYVSCGHGLRMVLAQTTATDRAQMRAAKAKKATITDNRATIDANDIENMPATQRSSRLFLVKIEKAWYVTQESGGA